ncbi:adenylyl-sulfate kinase [Pseudopedobacter beijingensis]|uniref:Adenylyl-sulfate kinase n=1 Tax=Pseudopedobacter beijingensis TaxID=1207056 RepID=A0ABW4IAD3_9SPHI
MGDKSPISAVFDLNKPILNQKGIVVWLLGLSGAGKSTISLLLEERLRSNGFFSVLLDGDKLRSGMNQDLSFSRTDRSENIRRTAEVAKILADHNVVVICSLITPLQEHRNIANRILTQDYFEVYVDCPLNICEQRDVKGLYKKARNKEIPNFTGISSAFEPVIKPSLVLSTSVQTPDESTRLLYHAILPIISPHKK